MDNREIAVLAGRSLAKGVLKETRKTFSMSDECHTWCVQYGLDRPLFALQRHLFAAVFSVRIVVVGSFALLPTRPDITAADLKLEGGLKIKIGPNSI